MGERFRRPRRCHAAPDVVVSVREIEPDRYDRVAKLLVDAGDAPTFEAAAELLRSYRLQIVVDAGACADPAWQAALLTAVNAGNRAVHGGVHVVLGADPTCSLPWARGRALSAALAELGATLAASAKTGVPTIVFGSRPPGWAGAGRAPVVRAFAGQWVAGVSPDERAEERETPSVLAAVLAASIAVSETFQWLRGHAAAGDRPVTVSLWDPEHGRDGPAQRDLPAGLWLLGLGHLGQAYAWLLSLLPYPAGRDRALVLQDDDRLSPANRATSMLHRAERVQMRKTRLAAEVMEHLGWETTIIERRFLGGRLHAPGDPGVLLGGVDNPQARRLLDDTGFPVIYDAGLGAGPDGFLAMTIRRLPGSRSSRELWPAELPAAPVAAAAVPAYAALTAETGNPCGVEQLAGRTVATSFVGVAAACWVIGGLLRELHGGPAFALVDYTLRDPCRAVAIEAADVRPPRVATVRCGP